MYITEMTSISYRFKQRLKKTEKRRKIIIIPS